MSRRKAEPPPFETQLVTFVQDEDIARVRAALNMASAFLRQREQKINPATPPLSPARNLREQAKRRVAVGSHPLETVNPAFNIAPPPPEGK